MKRHISILLMLLVLCNVAYSEEADLMKEMLENYLQIRQKPGSEQIMKEYIEEANMKSDTIYAILYAPMNCPRCEACIRLFSKMLKKNNENNQLLLISAYSDSILASNYNRKNKYIADAYIYDTNKKYEDIFSFNSNGLYSLCILKICKSSGRLIIGGDATEISEEFVAQLVAQKDAMECHLFDNENVDEIKLSTAPKLTLPELKCGYSDYKIVTDSEHFVSTVYDLPKFEYGKFFYTDVLNNGVMLFSVDDKEKKMRFKSLVQADSIEKRKFIKVSEEIYQQFINSGSVFYIACGASLLDKNDLGVSYSLPCIFYEASQDSNIIRLGYRNEAAIVGRKIATLEQDSLSSYDFEVEKTDYFYAHYTFMPFDDKILIGCKKLTWPLEFEPGEYKDDISRNSFHDGFYDTNNPFMAVFSRKTGKLVERFGHMEESQRKSRTGYFFVKSVACAWGDKILYCNGYAGQLYLSKKSDLGNAERSYSAFEIDVDNFPPVDSTLFYTYEYVKPYNKFFTKCIESVKMNDDYIYCLVRHGLPKDSNNPLDKYSLITINKNNGKREEKLLPRYDGVNVLGYGLQELDGGVIKPFVFMKKGGDAFVRVLQVK